MWCGQIERIKKNAIESQEQYRVEVSNRFAGSDREVDINVAGESTVTLVQSGIARDRHIGQFSALYKIWKNNKNPLKSQYMVGNCLRVKICGAGSCK
jgi:hypothetical protein